MNANLNLVPFSTKLSSKLNKKAKEALSELGVKKSQLSDKNNLSFQDVKNGFESKASNDIFYGNRTKFNDGVTNNKDINHLRKLVRVFRDIAIPNFIKSYFQKEEQVNAANMKVKTLIDQAFTKANLKGLEKEAAPYQKKFKEVQDLLRKSRNGETMRPEYFDWLDFSKGGILETNHKHVKQRVKEFQKEASFKKAFLMGMGGSSMCPELLNTAFPNGYKGKDFPVTIMSHMDPATIKANRGLIRDDEAALIFTSKSGNTFEVMHVIQAVLTELSKKHSNDLNKAKQEFLNRAVFITEPKTYSVGSMYPATRSEGGENNGNLNKLIDELNQEAENKGWTERAFVVDHPGRAGGRNSLFTAVGTFIARLKGLDTNQLLKGAQDAVDDMLSAERIEDCDAAKYALLDTLLAKKNNFVGRYVMPYGEEYSAVPKFTAQLAGESNNKNDVDSLNQMWNKGPGAHHSDVEALCRNTGRRLLFEDIIIEKPSTDLVHTHTGLKSLENYQLKSMHQDMITKLALPFNRHIGERQGNPVITTIVKENNEYNLGYLAMRYMLSTAIQGGLQNSPAAFGLDKTIRQGEVEYFKKLKKDDAEDFGLTEQELSLST